MAEAKLKMLDYVKMANGRMRQNLGRASSLVAPLVELYSTKPSSMIRIVASGSSKNASLCIRNYMQEILRTHVEVVSPEAFVAGEYAYPQDAFNIVISQSGYSTNTLAALDVAQSGGIFAVALTGNLSSPMKDHAQHIFDYGVGVESVDFVTMGVLTLVEYLALFAIYAAQALGHASVEDVAQYSEELACAIDAHGEMLKAAQEFVGEYRLVLARKDPVMFVGNGANYGVASEATLKFNETLKLSAMFYEAEEFMHGPDMQITPSYTLFILDDEQGSERLQQIATIFAQVSASVYFVTTKPHGVAGLKEIVVSAVRPSLACIPHLALFQYIAAGLSEELSSWDLHPYLAAHEDETEIKADGYDDSIKELEAKASEQYGSYQDAQAPEHT